MLPFDVGDIQKRRGLLGPFRRSERCKVAQKRAGGNDVGNSILYFDYIR